MLQLFSFLFFFFFFLLWFETCVFLFPTLKLQNHSNILFSFNKSFSLSSIKIKPFLFSTSVPPSSIKFWIVKTQALALSPKSQFFSPSLIHMRIHRALKLENQFINSMIWKGD
ncbi:unnamed protein product [Prunus armeniaca]